MTNTIIIKGGNYTEVQQALSQWIALNYKSLGFDLKIEIQESREGIIRIEIGSELGNENFNYLVNYLKYPEKILYDIDIKGYSKLTDNSIYPNELIGKTAMIYIPDDDKDYDFVCGALENRNFKIDFGGKFCFLNSNEPFQELTSNFQVVKQDNFHFSKKETEETVTDKKLSRFNTRSIIVLGIVLIATIIYGQNLQSGKDIFFLLQLCSAGLFFWTYTEVNLLRYNNVFLKLLIPALVLTAIYHYFGGIYGYGHSILIRPEAAVILLISFRVIRLIYLEKLNREPDFDRYSKYELDSFFFFILMLATVLITHNL